MTFPTESRKVNIENMQEVLSEDLNAVSEYLQQIIRDFNVNVIQYQQDGYAYPGCIVHGCQVNVTFSGNAVVPIVNPGLVLWAPMLSLPGDIPYREGSLVPIPQTTVTSGNYTLPDPGFSKKYVVDIYYQPRILPLPLNSPPYSSDNYAARNFYNAPADTISAKDTPKYSVPYTLITINSGPQNAFPENTVAPRVSQQQFRLASFIVSNPVTPTGPPGLMLPAPKIPVPIVTYEAPFIWNLQNWPGTPHSVNRFTTITLADSLSAIRAEIASILGPNKNWYSQPDIDLKTVKSTIDEAQTNLNNFNGAFKGMKILRHLAGETNPRYFDVPAGCRRLYIKMWGPGGNGGAGTYYYPTTATVPNSILLQSMRILYQLPYVPGGGGGAGGYIEDVIHVDGVSTIPFWVGKGGSQENTFFGSDVAGAGANGGTVYGIVNPGGYTIPFPGTNGSGGSATGSSSALKVPGRAGGAVGPPAPFGLGYAEGVGAFNAPFCSFKIPNNPTRREPFYGGGGGGHSEHLGTLDTFSATGPVLKGGDGLILVYYA